MFLQIINPSSTPWFKENPFWGAISGFCAFMLAGLGFAVTGNILIGRILIGLAWPWAMFGLWLTFNGLIRRRKIICRITASVGILVAGFLLNKWVRPAPVRQMIQSQTTSSRNPPVTATNITKEPPPPDNSLHKPKHYHLRRPVAASLLNKPCPTPFHPNMWFDRNAVDYGQTAYQSSRDQKITGTNNAAQRGGTMFDVQHLGTGNFQNNVTVGNSTILKSDKVEHLTVKNNTAYGEQYIKPNNNNYDVGEWVDFLEAHDDLVIAKKDTSDLEEDLRKKLEAEWHSLPPAQREANQKELDTVLADIKNSNFSPQYRSWPPSFVNRPCDPVQP